MRHLKKGRKIGSDAEHGKAILRGLAAQVFEHGRIKTTEARAKEVRLLIDEVVTLAKKGDVHSRRRVLSMIEDRKLVHKIFSEIAPRFKDRGGGFTRILKIGHRQGDAAPTVFIELV
ncbi:MAG TPA: 50S ribosomal protein L17 [Actinobacteria bacterium]|nr:50S ribosomal protein L17 [Actinomycetota bacterium]